MGKIVFILPLLLLVAMVVSSRALAAEPKFECRWTDEPVTIDGKGDEPAWKSAFVIDKFRRAWEGDKERAPKSPTKVRLLWDKEFLYFFAEMQDVNLLADVKEHDGKVWTDDAFELFFKPAADNPGYYEFNFNPLNTSMDMFMPARGTGGWTKFRAADEFNIVTAVQVKGTLNKSDDKDEGWTVEVKIPWKGFKLTGGGPKAGDVWTCAPCRVNRYPDEKDEDLSSAAILKSKKTADFHLWEDYAELKFVGAKDAGAGAKPRAAGDVKLPPLVTSKVIGSPDPAKPYRAADAFPKLKIESPIFIANQPGSKLMWSATAPAPYAASKIIRFVDDPNVDSFETIKKTDAMVMSIAFHPQFATNGFVYIGKSGPAGTAPRKDQVVRYTVSRKPPYAVDLKSETTIIEWESSGHDGLAMAFDPKGMMFVTTGDGSSDSDKWLNGQKTSVLQAKVLRIDVDHPADGKQYSIPKDNPFVGDKSFRPETWAYGMRNPWRMAIDAKNGNLWIGQNGQDHWEQVYLIEKGANYGWSVFEGTKEFYPNRKRGPGEISKPIAEHAHAEARSLTGGLVYYGKAFPKLNGAYLYGDYSTGKIWAMRVDEKHQPTWHEEIADTTAQITDFGLDSKGELLIADHGGKKFVRLVPTPSDAPAVDFPKTLSASGLFKDVKNHLMADGVIPYSVNAELWSDGAYKQRFIAIPNVGDDRRIAYTNTRGWEFPDETVIVKSFALEREAGNPASRRWVETRFFTRQEGEWAGYSYIWNDEQTDATLVEAGGLDRDIPVSDAKATGGSRNVKWHYPSRTECMVCHSRAANFVIGLETLQMNRDQDYASIGGGVDNQLHFLESHKLLRVGGAEGSEKSSDHLPTPPAQQPKMPSPSDATASLDSRARAYIHANCAHCHVESGGGNALIETEFTRPLDQMRLVNVTPLHDTFNVEGAKLIAPGAPKRSVLLERMAARLVDKQEGQMPPLATNVRDDEAIKLIWQWIAAMPASPRH